MKRLQVRLRYKRRLLLVTPARTSRDFFEKVVDEFAAQADLHDWDLVLKAPRDRDYDTQASARLIASVCKELYYDDALVLVPAAPNAEYPALEEYLDGRSPCQVATFDLRLRVGRHPLPYTKTADLAAGRLAGAAARRYIGHLRLGGAGYCVVVQGRWGEDRVRGFTEIAAPVAAVSLSAHQNWDIPGGYSATLQAVNEEPEKEIHLVFCTNDEMALGARRAVIELRAGGSASVARTRVIGFDGTDAFKYLLDCRDAVLLNSVDVGIREQVRELMKMLLDGKGRDVLSREDTPHVELGPRGMLIDERQEKALMA